MKRTENKNHAMVLHGKINSTGTRRQMVKLKHWMWRVYELTGYECTTKRIS